MATIDGQITFGAFLLHIGFRRSRFHAYLPMMTRELNSCEQESIELKKSACHTVAAIRAVIHGRLFGRVENEFDYWS